MNNNIFIYIELTRDKKIRPVSLQLISKAFELKEKLNGSKIIACMISSDIDFSQNISTIKKYGADEIIIVKDEKLSEYNVCYYPEIILRIIKKYNPSIVLTGATQEGKETASYISTKLETGLTADCTNLSIDENGKLISTRPTFGGQLTADIMNKGIPQMATVQENVFELKESYKDSEVIHESIDISDIDNRVEIISKEYKEASVKDPSLAKIIVSGGLGASTKEGFRLISELAEKIQGAVAGSREAYEKGFITKSQQIGQTGKTVAPALYIAVGISGSNQHLTGIKNSGKIIAVNKDKNASIFQHADIGIIGDLYKVLPKLTEEAELRKEH